MHILLKEIVRTLFNLPPSPEFIGWNGERLTSKVLKKLDRKGYRGQVLRNVYIPKENGETSEIDVLYVTEKGIFVLESKNYSGWIFGSEKNRSWTQVLPGGRIKNAFDNPLRQNATHVRWLLKYLTVNIPIFPIVVFSERCELKKIELESKDAVVIKRDRLFKTIKELWDRSPNVLTPQMVVNVFQKLAPLTQVSSDVKKAHVDRIKEKYIK